MLRDSFLKFLPIASGLVIQAEKQGWIIGERLWPEPQCRYCMNVMQRQVEGEIGQYKHFVVETHQPECQRHHLQGRKAYICEPK